MGTRLERLKKSDMATQYQVEVKTSNKFLSGTDDDVFVEMTGTNGKIDFIKLDNKKKNDFEKGKITSVTFEGKDIGHLSKLSLKKSGKDDWRCDWVKVTVPTSGHVYEFGFDGRKNWKGTIFRCSKTQRPSNDHPR